MVAVEGEGPLGALGDALEERRRGGRVTNEAVPVRQVAARRDKVAQIARERDVLHLTT